MRKLCLLLVSLLMLLCTGNALADNAADYAKGMEMIANGQYEDAYSVFMALSGYEDADIKAYELQFTQVAQLTRLSDTSAIIRFDGVYGLVDFSTNHVVAPQWAETKKLADNRLAVRYGLLWGIIDGGGQTIFEPQWFDISQPNDADVCTTYFMGKYGLINLNGTELQSCSWLQIGDSYYKEDDGYCIYTPFYRNGLIRAKNEEKLWGYLDIDGKVVIEPQYTEAHQFAANDLATVVTTNGIHTLIDRTNTEAYFGNSAYFADKNATAYRKAVELRENGEYDEAINAFKALGDYGGAETQVNVTYYAQGVAQRSVGNWSNAVEAFTNAGNYSDAATQICATYYAKGESERAAGYWDIAIKAFTNAGDYSDAEIQTSETKYQYAKTLAENGDYKKAYALYTTISNYKDVSELLKNDINLLLEGAKIHYEIGKTVLFGGYKQAEYGDNEEQISWTVIARNGNKALLLSKYILDYQPYSTGSKTVTWQNSSLRKWLNDVFFYEAFSKDERQSIVLTQISNDINQNYFSISGGKSTKDKVFLLSYKEVQDYVVGSDAQITSATGYAKKIAKADDSTLYYWWIRSPGSSEDKHGGLQLDLKKDSRPVSFNVYNEKKQGPVKEGIRPAIWIDLESEFVYKSVN